MPNHKNSVLWKRNLILSRIPGHFNFSKTLIVSKLELCMSTNVIKLSKFNQIVLLWKIFQAGTCKKLAMETFFTGLPSKNQKFMMSTCSSTWEQGREEYRNLKLQVLWIITQWWMIPEGNDLNGKRRLDSRIQISNTREPNPFRKVNNGKQLIP